MNVGEVAPSRFHYLLRGARADTPVPVLVTSGTAVWFSPCRPDRRIWRGDGGPTHWSRRTRLWCVRNPGNSCPRSKAFQPGLICGW